MKHFGKYNNSQELEWAYQNGDIINPYVALVDGALDYNTQQPCLLGKWRNIGGDIYMYSFQILETDDGAWFGGVNIGQLVGLYPNGDGPYDMDVRLHLTTGEPNNWTMEFHVDNQSDMPLHEFYEGSYDYWDSGAMVDPNESNSTVNVEWDGVDTFTFYEDGLIINTINPECSE